MDLGLAGKTAIVSGGSKGIGRAIAETLAAEGARVAVVARGRAALDETVDAIRSAGGRAIGVVADMTDPEQVAGAVGEATGAFGPPDIAIANVDAPDAVRGGTFRCGFEDASITDFVQSHQKLVMSIVYLVQGVLPGMKDRRWGRLLSIGSHAAKEPHGPPNTMILSNVGRLGAVGLMKTLSYEYGRYNITSNVIATGSFDTPLARDYFAANGTTLEALEEDMRRAGVGACRFGKPRELAALAAFLCSERASFVSGETITVTGGLYQGTF